MQFRANGDGSYAVNASRPIDADVREASGAVEWLFCRSFGIIFWRWFCCRLVEYIPMLLD